MVTDFNAHTNFAGSVCVFMSIHGNDTKCYV